MKVGFSDNSTGEVLNEWVLTTSQEKFWQSQKKVILFSGGFGCGKSLMLVLKAIDMALKYPGNFILMGRKTYVELRDSLIKEFQTTCPDQLLDGDFRKAESKAVFRNKSEIIFRHLDKVSATEIRSMNLGCAFIDQAEDLDKSVFLAIQGRLRRNGVGDGDRKIYMTMNPELTWHYADFKQNPNPDYELIEASTLENEANLPKEYVADLLKYPENYKRQYVYGVWDESLLSGNTVFAREHISLLETFVRSPLKEIEGLKIYKEFEKGHRYQMGVDVAEGSEEETEKKDKSSITIADLSTLEEVAHWSGQVAPDVVGEKAVHFARMYQDGQGYCEILPEMNAIGLALVNYINQYDDILIYRREEFDKSVGKKLKKLGWRTTRQSKPLLINHFQELLRKRTPKVRTQEIVAEFRTFIHSDEARKSGMGAKTGFHDDRIMSCLLAFFEKGDVTPAKILNKSEDGSRINVPITPSLKIVDGKARAIWLEPKIEKSWKTT
jgi:hypothetical protein